METLACESGVIYEFNKNNAYTKKVASGTTVKIETYDCYKNQIQSEEMSMDAINWHEINPATGPIYVEGALPGDILKVQIEKIEIGSQGVMMVGPGLGVMGHRIEKRVAKVLAIRDEKIIFNGIQIPLNKMIGVIGVAPAEEGVSSETPGAHGGNMDNKMITEGATLYFPIFTEGALFSLGDLHAAMGDGEVGVSGVEVPGVATVRLEVIKGQTIQHPMLENEQVFTQIASAQTLDEASKIAIEEMIDRIVEKSTLSLEEVTMLMSAVGQIEICQIVDPLMTVRFVVPKWLLEELGIELI